MVGYGVNKTCNAAAMTSKQVQASNAAIKS